MKPDVYICIRNNLIRLYFKNIIYNFVLTLVAEISGVISTFLVTHLITFIKDPNQSFYRGIALVSAFVAT